MAQDVHDTALERLRAADQRYTSNRRRIVEALAAADRPLSLPEMLSVSRGLPQSSAYRNLTVLEEAGIVRRVVSGGEFARFELAEDLTEHHHHLVCSACGNVEDFTLPPDVEHSVDRALERAARRARFVAGHHRLDLVGLCAACQ